MRSSSAATWWSSPRTISGRSNGKPVGYENELIEMLRKFAPFEIRQQILPWTGLLAGSAPANTILPSLLRSSPRSASNRSISRCRSPRLRCIDWLEKPDTGAVFLSGRRVGIRSGGHIAMAQVRTHIGMVFQHFALWPHLTVLQNVMEAPLHVQKRPRAEVRAAADALLHKVGLSDKRNAFPPQLSGRQKQRVGIARALAVRPDLCCSTSRPARSIPSWSARSSWSRELARDGMTMVIVTHEMGFARDAATRMVFIDRGRVVETGTPAQFFSAPATIRARQFLQRYAAAIAAS